MLIWEASIVPMSLLEVNLMNGFSHGVDSDTHNKKGKLAGLLGEGPVPAVLVRLVHKIQVLGVKSVDVEVPNQVEGTYDVEGLTGLML